MQPSTEEIAPRLLQALEQQLPRAVALRRRLHARPELAHAEQWTAAAVAAELPVACEVAAGTGRLARIGAASAGAAVAVRAELDGLPLQERTGAPFSSEGEAMHACGHDVHMAALVALARAAQELSTCLPAPLLAIFQPSEEAYPSGAQQLAAGELAQRPLRGVVAAHVHPDLAWGTVAIDPGAVNASCDAVEIVVEGQAAHGAYPHRGRDPILAIAQIVVALHAELGRLDPLAAASLTVGVLEAGSAENVIPASARARAALRAHRPAERAALREMVRRVATGVANAHGCQARIELVAGEPALENDPAIVERARSLLSAAGLQPAPPWRSSASDDFAFFGALAPLAMAFVGLDGAEGFRARPLHHPELLVPDSAVGAVARAQAVLYLAACG